MSAPLPFDLDKLAARVAAVPGVVGVTLGGSRARGTGTPESDVDLGLYDQGRLDLDALGALARAVGGPQARVTARGEWGPWVDGGAWLHVAGHPVDWLYRDLRRVRQGWDDARAGRFTVHAQVGHPLGVPSFWYPAELALSVVLQDPTGALTRLREQTLDYPEALRATVVRQALWEGEFLCTIAQKAVARQDSAYLAACLARAVGMWCHALHARAGRWLVNEKGAVDGAARCGAPEGFAEGCRRVTGRIGTTAEELATTLAAATQLAVQVRRCTAG